MPGPTEYCWMPGIDGRFHIYTRKWRANVFEVRGDGRSFATKAEAQDHIDALNGQAASWWFA